MVINYHPPVRRHLTLHQRDVASSDPELGCAAKSELQVTWRPQIQEDMLPHKRLKLLHYLFVFSQIKPSCTSTNCVIRSVYKQQNVFSRHVWNSYSVFEASKLPAPPNPELCVFVLTGFIIKSSCSNSCKNKKCDCLKSFGCNYQRQRWNQRVWQ